MSHLEEVHLIPGVIKYEWAKDVISRLLRKSGRCLAYSSERLFHLRQTATRPGFDCFVDLTELANRFGTDKGTIAGDRHGYAEIYSATFEAFRLEEFTMLELGLLVCENREIERNPKIRSSSRIPSTDMWLSYFPNAHCFGFDLSNFAEAASKRDRFTFIQGDLSKDEDIDRLALAVGATRLIIDDASHTSYHQQRAFAKLFPILQPGGFYIIEDLHYSPPFEHTLPDCRPMADLVRDWIQTKKLDLDFCSLEACKAMEASIAHIFVHCSSRGARAWGPKLAMIQKRQ